MPNVSSAASLVAQEIDTAGTDTADDRTVEARRDGRTELDGRLTGSSYRGSSRCRYVVRSAARLDGHYTRAADVHGKSID